MRTPQQEPAKFKPEPITTCPNCLQDTRFPFRRFNKQAKIITGCVDASHTGKLAPDGASIRWHERPDAIDVREQTTAAMEL